MGGPGDYRTKQSKSEGERQVSYGIACMWNLTYDRNKPIYDTEIDYLNKTKLKN